MSVQKLNGRCQALNIPHPVAQNLSLCLHPMDTVITFAIQPLSLKPVSGLTADANPPKDIGLSP
jgi:hypothetical protein